MVIGPRLNEDHSCIELEVNIRVLEGDDEAVYAIDSIYAYEQVPTTRFMDEVYPRIIDELEESFEDSQLQYYQL